MEGRIVNYVGSKGSYMRNMIVALPENNGRTLLGKRVECPMPKGSVRGRVIDVHGQKGNLVIVRFDKPLPGQSLGKTVKIL